MDRVQINSPRYYELFEQWIEKRYHRIALREDNNNLTLITEFETINCDIYEFYQ